MAARSALIGVVLALVGAAPAAAAASSKPLFAAASKTGAESCTYVGYSFGVLKPPLGKHGTIEVDCPVKSRAAVDKALPKGATLNSARLVVSATLPKPQHFTFHFAGAKVKSILFVNGHFGLTAAITLTFAKLTESAK
jgi:opacity protein-like surface antigen